MLINVVWVHHYFLLADSRLLAFHVDLQFYFFVPFQPLSKGKHATAFLKKYENLAMLAEHIYPRELSSTNGTLVNTLLLDHLSKVIVKIKWINCRIFLSNWKKKYFPTSPSSLTSPSSTLLFVRSFSSSWCHSRWVASAYLKANLQTHWKWKFILSQTFTFCCIGGSQTSALLPHP